MAAQNMCMSCGKPVDPDTEFRDTPSRKEWDISHFCQTCQDRVFPPSEQSKCDCGNCSCGEHKHHPEVGRAKMTVVRMGPGGPEKISEIDITDQIHSGKITPEMIESIAEDVIEDGQHRHAMVSADSEDSLPPELRRLVKDVEAGRGGEHAASLNPMLEELISRIEGTIGDKEIEELIPGKYEPLAWFFALCTVDNSLSNVTKDLAFHEETALNWLLKIKLYINELIIKAQPRTLGLEPEPEGQDPQRFRVAIVRMAHAISDGVMHGLVEWIVEHAGKDSAEKVFGTVDKERCRGCSVQKTCDHYRCLMLGMLDAKFVEKAETVEE